MGRELEPYERLFVALDTPDAERARELARRLAGRVGGFKVGLELFTSHGPDLVRELRDAGRLFLDLKLHDISNTVARTAEAIARLGIDYFTVHASGGSAMVQRAALAATDAADAAGLNPPRVLAVTVLTSLDDDALAAVGLRGPTASAVERLAILARQGQQVIIDSEPPPPPPAPNLLIRETLAVDGRQAIVDRLHALAAQIADLEAEEIRLSGTLTVERQKR